jgi:hypothetical protein
MKRKLIYFIILFAFPLSAKLTNVSVHGGLNTHQTAYFGVGAIFDNKYHIIFKYGGPLLSHNYGTDINDDEPFDWWEKTGQEDLYYLIGVEFDIIFKRVLSVGIGLNHYSKDIFEKYESPISGLKFSRTYNERNFIDASFHAKYRYFNNIMLGVFFGTSGYIGAEISFIMP